jgi:hypothetical protein
MLYDLGYGVISEHERLIEEKREELVNSQPAAQGSSANNIVGRAREAAKPIE